MNPLVQTFDSLTDFATGDELTKGVRETVIGLTKRFPREYWLKCSNEDRFIDEMWESMGDLGLLGLSVPEEYGGTGGGVTAVVLLQDMLARAGVPPLMMVVTGLARIPILKYGTPEQIERFVTPTVSGKMKICFAITEPEAGTNSFKITTSAKKDGSGWVLNGQKTFISAANQADYMLVVARTRPYKPGEERKKGISLFMLDLKSKGIELQPLNIAIVGPEKQFTVFFDNVKLPEEALIGPEGDGMAAMFDALNPERLLTAATAVGIGDYALGRTVDYVKQRAPFGAPLGSYQAVQHPLARAKARIESSRIMMYQAAKFFDMGGNAGPASNMVKLLASEAGVEACDAAIQFHGGNGFDTDYDIITLWPFARLMRVAPINNEMLLNYISERVLGLPKSY